MELAGNGLPWFWSVSGCQCVIPGRLQTALSVACMTANGVVAPARMNPCCRVNLPAWSMTSSTRPRWTADSRTPSVAIMFCRPKLARTWCRLPTALMRES
jgi:hypothetical protein